MSAPEDRFSHKVHADALVWAREWNTRVTPLLLLRLLLLEPGFQLAFSIRVQAVLTTVPVVGLLLRRLLWYVTTVWTGADVDPCAVRQIGAGVHFPHPAGVVIGGQCSIGRNVQILQGVTLGRSEASIVGGPGLEDGVRVYAGAKLIGDIRVGQGAVVGANAVVLKDVPPGWTAVGVPARNLPPRRPGLANVS